MPNLAFHQSQHNWYRVWTPGRYIYIHTFIWQQRADVAFTFAVPHAARPAWKRCGGGQEKKEEEKNQRISDPSTAGRREEEAAWTLRQSRLTEELRVEDPQSFNYLRMEPAMLDELVQRVGPRIEKQDSNMRKALHTGFKLAITVRLAITIIPWMTPECFEYCLNAVRLLRMQ